jgi:uncharacterized protein (UPF0548 family)
MFLPTRPSASAIDRFLRDSQELPLSYEPIGIVNGKAADRNVVERVVAIGHGAADFERAREALRAWKQFDVGWVEAIPRQLPVACGTVVAVLIRHLGFWSLNGCRVVYDLGTADDRVRFGYAHGTLINHAESGEEIFEVFVDPRTNDVMYRIRAMSWPHAVLARLGQPLVRLLQARFVRDSGHAMRRATQVDGTRS